MLNILGIDTSSSDSSIALLTKDGNFHHLGSSDSDSHNEELASLVQKILSENSVQPREINGLVVGSGPGSFTGLRIGFSFVKGFSFAHSIPVVAVSSLKGAACSVDSKNKYRLAIEDARREEYFVALYNLGTEICDELIPPQILPESDVKSLIERYENMGLAVISSCDLSSKVGLKCQKPLELARSLILLAQRELAESRFNIGALSALKPDYIRAVAARTIAERAAR